MPRIVNNAKIERQMHAGALATSLGEAISFGWLHPLKAAQIIHEVLTARDINNAAICWAAVLRDESPEEIAAYSYAAEIDAMSEAERAEFFDADTEVSRALH